MSKKIGLIESKILVYIGNGSAWLAYGVLSLFDNMVCVILSTVFLLCGLASLLLGMSSKEKDDEMSNHNLLKAKARTMDNLKIIVLVILMFISVIGLLHMIFPLINENIFVSLKTVVSTIIGVSEIMIGVLFLKYERDGE